MSLYKNIRGPFRDRNGLLLGVLKGLGRHWGIPPWILRLVVVVLAVLTAFWVVACCYLAAALVMPTRPDNWLGSNTI